MQSTKWPKKEFLNLLIESEDEFIWQWDVVSGEMFFDENYLKKLGYKTSENTYKFDWWQNKIHPEHQPEFNTTLKSCLSGKNKHFKIFYRIKTELDDWIWMQTIGRWIETDKRGIPTRFIGIHRNINKSEKLKQNQPGDGDGSISDEHARQQISALEQANKKLNEEIDSCRLAEDQLRESEAKIKLLLNSTAEGIFGMDTNGRCTFCNSACVNILGYETEKDILAQNIHELIHHTRADGSVCPLEECRIFSTFRIGQGVYCENDIFWWLDHRKIKVEYRSHPILKNDEVIGAVVTFNDITEKSRTKKLLEKSLQTSADIVREIPSGLFTYQYIVPDKLILLDGNRSGEILSGINIMEWKGLEFNDIWPNAKKDGLAAAFLEVVKNGKTYRTENKVYKDERLEGAFKIHAFKLPGNKLAVAFDNITEIRQNEEERERLIEQLKKALNEINTLRGILPICSSCKKIRDDTGYWNQIEYYISIHSDAEFSHGICPDCAEKLYPDEFNPYKK